MRHMVVLAAVAAAACSLRAGDAAETPPFAEEIAAFAAADAADFPAACRVLFVGSSSFRFWDTLAEDMAPIEVVRRGFGGSQMEHVNLYFDTIVAPYEPRAIVVYEGENDISAGKSPADVVADVERFLAMKTEALGATPVYVVSIKVSKLRFAERPAQIEANAMIADLAAAREDVVFIDIASAMMADDGTPKDIFIADDLHMTADGYAIWTPIIRGALEQPAPTTAPGCS